MFSDLRGPQEPSFVSASSAETVECFPSSVLLESGNTTGFFWKSLLLESATGSLAGRSERDQSKGHEPYLVLEP